MPRSCLQDCDAGEGLALEELQAGAAAGGDVTETGLVEAEDAYGRGGVATTDDRERAVRAGVDESLSDCTGARRERLELEHAGRTVPDNGLRVKDLAPEQLGRGRADVQADAAVRDRVSGDHVVRGVGSEGVRHDDVRGQDDLDAALGCLVQVALDGLDLV